MANKLRPCPFCGEEPKTEIRQTRDGFSFDVVCPKCKAEQSAKWMEMAHAGLPTFDDFADRINEAISFWNTRVSE